jgi:protoporphyrinogen/coproporphyrinogen III oxidase
MPQYRKVTVIGGGISGLACAYRLKTLGIDVALFEATERAGGLVRTVQQDGFRFESGPQSFLATEVLLGLIEQLGIRGELQEANPRAPRYILLNSRLEKVPLSPLGLLTTSLLGFRSRWKLLSEPFRHTQPPDSEETIANFVRRKFGQEMLQNLVAPFVSGVYAGDPEKLSLRAAFPSIEEWERNYGSVLRGAIKSHPSKSDRKGKRFSSLCSFRRGADRLTRALAENLVNEIETHTCVLAIKRSVANRAAVYEIRTLRKGQEETRLAGTIVMATPADIASQLIGRVSSGLAEALASIAYTPVAVVAAGYRAQQIARSIDGFGFLVSRREPIRTLGTVWNSSLFPDCAPPEMATLTSFAGGATDAGVVAKPEAEIQAIVHDENARILKITGPPAVSAVWKHLNALPQYNLGHGHRVQLIQDAEREFPGLFFAGNYIDGPAIGKCVERAFKTADAVRDYLGSPA